MKWTPKRDNWQYTTRPTNFKNMEVETTNISNWVARRIVESQEITQQLATEQLMLFDSQSLTLHN